MAYYSTEGCEFFHTHCQCSKVDLNFKCRSGLSYPCIHVQCATLWANVWCAHAYRTLVVGGYSDRWDFLSVCKCMSVTSSTLLSIRASADFSLVGEGGDLVKNVVVESIGNATPGIWN